MASFLSELDPKVKAKTMSFINADESLSTKMPRESEEEAMMGAELAMDPAISEEPSWSILEELETIRERFTSLNEQEKLTFISQLLA